jgi:predicted choloylglycine hydrolase
MQLIFNSIYEPVAEFKWKKLFNERWPSYRTWLKANSPIADSRTSRAALQKYMPEMIGTYEHLCHLVHADELAASFLTGFQPPVYHSACSQAVSTKGTVQLVRNYDYHPHRFEGTLLMSAWNGKKVIANSDSLIGVLDGMNEDGLAISLTFGGRKVVGFGFGIPFILRYILEFCSTVEEAVGVLLRIPSHMSYNITVTDRSGRFKTVQIAPDRTAVVMGDAFATNHQQGAIEWPENATLNRTVERAALLQNMLTYDGVGGDNLVNSFLQPPLYNTLFSEGLGTLYTAVYRPNEGTVQLHWPNDYMMQTFDGFSEEKKLIKFSQSGTSLVRKKGGELNIIL